MIASTLCSTWEYVHLKVDFDLECPILDTPINLQAMAGSYTPEALSASSQSCDATVCSTGVSLRQF